MKLYNIINHLPLGFPLAFGFGLAFGLGLGYASFSYSYFTY